MLNRFEVSVAREEVDGVDTLRYSFEKLLAQAVSESFGCENTLETSKIRNILVTCI